MKKEEKENSVIVVTLRKLALKSVLDFGKFEGQTIQQVLDQNHTRMLRWYYYNCSRISFLPEILRRIGIGEEDEIPKPGKNPEKGIEVDERLEKKGKRFCKDAFLDGDKKKIATICRQKQERVKAERAILVRSEISDRSKFSKAAMQRRNHGHRS